MNIGRVIRRDVSPTTFDFTDDFDSFFKRPNYTEKSSDKREYPKTEGSIYTKIEKSSDKYPEKVGLICIEIEKSLEEGKNLMFFSDVFSDDIQTSDIVHEKFKGRILKSIKISK